MKLCLLDAQTLGSDLDLTPIVDLGETTIYDLSAPEEVAERIQDVEVIITNKVVLNETNLSQAKHLKLIALTATGYNNIDLEYTKARGIAVVNVAGYSTQSVAQHTFAMLLYLMEQLSFYDQYVKDRKYEKSNTFAYIGRPFTEISGKRWGIIGLGAIGKEVAKIATVFGAKVCYYSTSGKNSCNEYESVELERLLKESDIISIHAPLNENTQNLIDYNALSLMKETAYLVNVGRGSIINERDLVKALNENKIKGVALDVLEEEPIKRDHPLYQVQDSSKWLVTPHIAWASIEARTRLVYEIQANIEAFYKGERRNRIV